MRALTSHSGKGHGLTRLVAEERDSCRLCPVVCPRKGSLFSVQLVHACCPFICSSILDGEDSSDLASTQQKGCGGEAMVDGTRGCGVSLDLAVSDQIVVNNTQIEILRGSTTLVYATAALDRVAAVAAMGWSARSSAS